jgi:putative phosphoribosyl transferase
MPDVRVFNHDVIRNFGVSEEAIDSIIAAERNELLRRNRLYRGGEPPPKIDNRVVILVDDGMATGANMRAAVSAVGKQNPLRVIVAVPVGSQEACENLKRLADVVVCLQAPELFFGVGQAYEEFEQTGDDEVLSLLEESKRRHFGSANDSEDFEHAHSSL